MQTFPDVRLDMSIKIFSPHELLVAHVARRHRFLQIKIKTSVETLRNFTHLHVNELEMLPQSRLPVELLPAMIARQRVFAVVVKHVSLELRVLNEFFPANFALVIAATRVCSDVSVERFLGGKTVSAFGTAVGTFSGVNASKNHIIFLSEFQIPLNFLPMLRQRSTRWKTFAAVFPVAQIRLLSCVCANVNVQ